MAEPKTRPTKASVAKFIAAAQPESRRVESRTIARMMRQATGARPVMWGPSIVGFGKAPIRYADGRTLDWPAAAFSPRRAALVLYLKRRFAGSDALVARLGKVKTGGGCLYVKRLADVDLPALQRLIDASVAATAQRD